MTDFSKPETRELFEREVKRRQQFGMSREQAEMLTAALMWDGPKTAPPEDGELTQTGDRK